MIETPKDLLHLFICQFENGIDNLQPKDIIKKLPFLVIQIEKMSKTRGLNGEDKYKLLEMVLRSMIDKFITNQECKDMLLTFIINDLDSIISSIVVCCNTSRKLFKKTKSFMRC